MVDVPDRASIPRCVRSIDRYPPCSCTFFEHQLSSRESKIRTWSGSKSMYQANCFTSMTGLRECGLLFCPLEIRTSLSENVESAALDRNG